MKPSTTALHSKNTDSVRQRFRWQNARSVVESARLAAAGSENIDPAGRKSNPAVAQNLSPTADKHRTKSVFSLNTATVYEIMRVHFYPNRGNLND
ncbi:MAG TPA: hypothetical protein VLB07_13885 [Woeseiaceae bacterium]|nr:hypothetical protein [Woeseiaceae bacterium]